jgi:hypothetical protein
MIGMSSVAGERWSYDLALTRSYPIHQFHGIDMHGISLEEIVDLMEGTNVSLKTIPRVEEFGKRLARYHVLLLNRDAQRASQVLRQGLSFFPGAYIGGHQH